MKFAVLAVFLVGTSASSTPALRQAVLPDEALRVLQAPHAAILYSLEPLKFTPIGNGTLHGFTILGRTTLDAEQARHAADAFVEANKRWDGNGSDCFEPRHAMRISFGGHTYDFLLCFHCHELDVYEDDHFLSAVGASGSPKFLNTMLTAAHVPVSRSDVGEP